MGTYVQVAAGYLITLRTPRLYYLLKKKTFSSCGVAQPLVHILIPIIEGKVSL